MKTFFVALKLFLLTCAFCLSASGQVTTATNIVVRSHSRLNAEAVNNKAFSPKIGRASPAWLHQRAGEADTVHPARIDPAFSNACWRSFGGLPGLDGWAFSFVVNTNTGVVYVGGGFTIAGAVKAANIAQWDGEAWSALGDGINGPVYMLALDQSGNLYAGGSFNRAGGVWATNIARWDGRSWSPLGSGVDSAVTALTFGTSGELCVGGLFTTAGGVSANYIAQWNGSSWSALGSGMNDWVEALAVSGGKLYAGGYFTSAGGVSANGIAKWNGRSWSVLGSGLGSELGNMVDALVIDRSGNLYAGGFFRTAGGVQLNNIAKWDGIRWRSLGTGMDGQINALAVDGAGNLFAGGDFGFAGGIAASRIAKWDGSAWSALGSGVASQIYTLAVDGSANLYAGGSFTFAGGRREDFVARWNGNAWTGLGPGMDNPIYTLVVDNSGILYAGGYFTATPDGRPANRIASWDGKAWSALGGGMNDQVNILVADRSGNVYAGGAFTTAGGVPANYVAKWNGSVWSALGSGMNNRVNALVLDGAGNLYAGGEFTSAGGVQANFVAEWDGNAWSPVSYGLDNSVTALAMDSSGTLYAGGFLPVLSYYFGAPFGSTHVAGWNGAGWYALPDLWGHVSALAVDPAGNLFAGGNAFIAELNGYQWLVSGIAGCPPSALFPAVNSFVVDCAGNLYAGGAFTSIAGISANCIAVWDGTQWSALGSGLNGQVNAMALGPSEKLYVGGAFTTAGSNVSAYAAQANVAPFDFPILVCPTNMTLEFTSAAGATVFFYPNAIDPCSGAFLEVASIPPSGSTFPIGTNTVTCSVTNNAGNGVQCSFTVTVLGPRDVKANVLTEMTALSATNQSPPIHLLDSAIASLADSLTESSWVDDTHLAAAYGREVFKKEAETVRALCLSMNDGIAVVPDATLQQWIDRIVKSDRLLAIEEIEKASDSGAASSQLLEAYKQINEGDDSYNAHEYVEAILHYCSAWEQALPAHAANGIQRMVKR
jgi:hypothetical protein